MWAPNEHTDLTVNGMKGREFEDNFINDVIEANVNMDKEKILDIIGKITINGMQVIIRMNNSMNPYPHGRKVISLVLQDILAGVFTRNKILTRMSGWLLLYHMVG